MSDEPENRASWLSKSIARLSLSLPRYSPLRWEGRRVRKQMIEQGAEPFEATSHDGAHIDALYFPRAADLGDRLPVVINHGYLEAKELHLGEANLLREHGHDVVMYDLRGHGDSGGKHTTLGVHEREDLTAIIDEAAKRRFIGGRLMTMGYSTGAAVVIQQAPYDARVAGAVALTPFVGMLGAVKSFRAVHGPWYNEEKLLRGFEQVSREKGFDMAQSDTLKAISDLNVPLLLAVGDADIHLPPGEHAERLMAAAPAGLIEFHLVKERNHISIYRSLRDELKDSIVKFCRRISEGEAGAGGDSASH